MKEASPHLQFRQNPVTVHRSTIRALAEKVNPAHCALIVIDIQNDFCAPAAQWTGKEATLRASGKCCRHYKA